MNRVVTIIIFVLASALGLFFIYKGINKHFLSPCKVYAPDSTLPEDYRAVISALCNSGFTTMVGFFQVLSGLLLIIPRTRLFGAIILLPIIANIFFMHFFMDNRPEELVETGIPFLITLLIIGFHYKKWMPIFGKN